jgi:hypothetical protein
MRIARFLNERFTEKNGYQHLKGVSEVGLYDERFWRDGGVGRGLQLWIMKDVYETALDPSDGSREFFKIKSEAFLKCPLQDTLEVRGGGEAAVLKQIRDAWAPLRERMKAEDDTVEREFLPRTSLTMEMYRS